MNRDIRTRDGQPVDVAPLRTEAVVIVDSTDHFCALCGCTKSGWADLANQTTDWCEDLECPCHDEDVRP